MTDKRLSYTFDSTLESVDRAEEVANQVAANAGFGEDDCQKISMAVREAAVNAVLHGNAYDPRRKMRVSYDSTGDALTITVADEGKGLNPDDIPDPLAPENLLKQSGRGVFLMRTFMDEVRFRSLEPGTEITLIKRMSGEAASAKEGSK